MARQNVYVYIEGERPRIDGWFDLDSAQRYYEETSWDGRVHTSLATGEDRTHEELWRTVSGRWVRHWWSDWSESQDRWEGIAEDEAREWLIRCEYDDAAIEEATGEAMPAEMGRPEIGPQIKVRLPQETIAAVDALAKSGGVSRSAWVRAAVEDALSRHQ